MLQRMLTSFTHKITELPILVLMPHSRCNCRCVMCDIWKANQNKVELSSQDLARHVVDFKKLKVKRVALSGGEALMHSNLWSLCEQLRMLGIKISLLSTGLTLKQHASEIIQYIDDIIVSLDGSAEVHNQIRNIPNAFEKLHSGILEVRRLDEKFKITGRSVLQKLNYHDFLNIIAAAKQLELNQISFLPADVSSEAFNRPNVWEEERISGIALTPAEVGKFKKLVQVSFELYASEYDNGFIAESPKKMNAVLEYYSAMLSSAPFPSKKCNAPWVSAVVESDGQVRPCFFHESYGNIHDTSFEDIINSEKAISFRRGLDVNKNSTCQRCVCSLHVGVAQSHF